MKVWIKILIAGVIGFGGGFASGFIVHKKMNDVQFEEISEEEMKEIEDGLKNSKEQVRKAVDEIFDPVNAAELPEDPDKLRSALQGKTPYIQADAEQKKAYEKMWKATKEYSNEENANEIPTMKEEAEDGDESFDEEFIEAIESEDKDTYVEPPHMISLAEFYNERPEYDKITIDWYEPDNVWLDEREEIIGDIASYVGLEAGKLFDREDDDPDVRFVRNEQYGSDYEIIRHHRSYKEATGGV